MLLNQREFADAVGIKYSTLRSHLHRKKILKVGEYIDTESEQAISYINEHTDGSGMDLTKYHKKKLIAIENQKQFENQRLTDLMISDFNSLIDNAVKSIKENAAQDIAELVRNHLKNSEK